MRHDAVSNRNLACVLLTYGLQLETLKLLGKGYATLTLESCQVKQPRAPRRLCRQTDFLIKKYIESKLKRQDGSKEDEISKVLWKGKRRCQN